MDDYAGRVLADRYRLPLPPSDAYELVETRAFDTYSGQEVLVRQLPLPEVVDAEVVDTDGRAGAVSPRRATGRATRRPTDPAVRRAIEAAQAAAQIPDHPRLDQVFDVFAEAGSLWIVSEMVAARPLAALLAERPLNPYRAAEIGSDVLTALRALHAHGWTHRNITVRTVLVCDDGRVVLTGLAAGAAEEALCGYAPVPVPDDEDDEDDYGQDDAVREDAAVEEAAYGDDHRGEYGDGYPYGDGEESDYRGEILSPEGRPYDPPPGGQGPSAPALPMAPSEDARAAARAGAIAAYRAGARAAARAHEAGGAPALPPGPAPAASPPAPQWWTQVAAAEDDDFDDDDTASRPGDPAGGGAGQDEDGGEGPRRALLAGTWHDGPSGGRDAQGSLPAGGGVSPYGGGSPYARRGDGSWQGGGSGEALRADAQRVTRVPEQPPATGRWNDIVATGQAPAYRGPATPLAAERARQARIAVVGAVTERWAPEQAGPVHENWQLAPPIGPSTDLWALGALLYRAVQGHAPYPEENAAELVQMVCAEPPAFAEECGPLRPVVESLLRQDPTERPDFEELRGWLRSLVRSAPEPEAGTGIVAMPAVDETRLPVVRRRGELVRKRRAGTSASAHGRHRQRRGGHAEGTGASAPARGRGPRALGRVLLVAILLALAAAIAYAVMYMPKAPSGRQDPARSPAQGQGQPQPRPSAAGPTSDDGAGGDQQPTPGTQDPSTNAVTPSSPALTAGYAVRDDPEGFRIGVDKSWQRNPINDVGQVRYIGGEYTLIVVPGRDTVQANGADPMEYQRNKERELQPWRESSWATASGLRRIDVGQQVMAEGQFTWQDGNGREVYVRNLALVVDGRYHVVQVIGPDSERDKVSEIYQQAVKAYRSTR
ncbi:protein kinase [Streptomyces sp. SP18CS02]|uniref:protein kinase n=1 Tax=Streptomyces sp. SP18CS02 TaxID=3002531 RepID=UPI002E77F2EA|nr:protein kinase [Streptomyces sp. SP18CS02]MEE1756084.1 protein kinase [Streptomyces sp. SP18CS02]